MIRLATKFRPDPPAFAVAVRAGMHFAELWTDADLLLDWQTVAALAKSYPLGYALHFPNRLDQPSEVLHGAVNLYRALDARSLVLHQPHMDRHGAALHRLDPRLRLAVENHRIDSIDSWANACPGLALDVEHLWMYNLEGRPLGEVLAVVRDLLHRHGEKLQHVHLPGYLPGQPEHRPMYCSRDLVLGMFDLLEAIDFTGLVVSEVNPEFQNEEELRMDVLLHRRWLAMRERKEKR